MRLSPSLLAANFKNLTIDIEAINASKADLLHIDIMDGRFVPNISFGFPVLDAVSELCTKPLDIHLMIIEPDRYIERFLNFKPEFLSFHIEVEMETAKWLKYIRNAGSKAGLAISPDTPIETLEPFLDLLDQVVVMSVQPGFGGQKFIEKTHDRVKELVELRGDRKIEIEIDGGVTLQNAAALLASGSDILVAGSSVFGTPNIVDTVYLFKTL